MEGLQTIDDKRVVYMYLVHVLKFNYIDSGDIASTFSAPKNKRTPPSSCRLQLFILHRTLHCLASLS